MEVSCCDIKRRAFIWIYLMIYDNQSIQTMDIMKFILLYENRQVPGAKAYKFKLV